MSEEKKRNEAPEETSDEELSVEELEQAAGGAVFAKYDGVDGEARKIVQTPLEFDGKVEIIAKTDPGKIYDVEKRS